MSEKIVNYEEQICSYSVFVLCVPSSILCPLDRLFHSKVEAFHHNRFSVFRGTSDLNTSLRVAESSLTMDLEEEFRTRVEAKSTEAGSRGYGIGEDFHDGEKDLLPSEVLLQPNANEIRPAKHDGKEGHACGVCNKEFKRAAELRRHERTHSGEKLFSCSLCGQSFSQSGHLRRHELIHTGGKPFRCLICDAAFAQSSTLRTHERTHTGEKPFRCPTCDAAFAHSSHLR
ncbi:unnamed protein product, partial [Cyprideis torosa]